MCSPNDNAGQSTGACLQSGEISDTTFIESAAVVDDEDVAAERIRHRFEKNINASEMARG
jgi:hypothetical protein